MVFKDTRTLSGLYEGITKKVEPSKDQLIEQAPILSNTALSKDQDMLLEAYNVITNKGAKEVHCKYAAKGCDCDGCEECKDNQEPIEEAKKKAKPDYMDVDKDGNKKEPMKKALKDKKKHEMKEQISSFKDLFNKVISEDRKTSFGPSPYSNVFEHDKRVWMLRRMSNGEISEINNDEQYNVVWKDAYVKKHNNQKEQPLKGESVLSWLDEIESISRAHSEQA